MLMGVLLTSVSFCGDMTFRIIYEQKPVDNPIQKDNAIKIKEIRQHNISLKSLLSLSLQSDRKGEYLAGSRFVVDKITQEISNGNIKDESVLTDSYYLIGVYYNLSKNNNESIKFLNLAAALKENNKEIDKRLANVYYNIGLAYNGLGDFTNQEYYSMRSLKVEEKLFGESSPSLISTYSSLIIAYIEQQEYEKAVSFSNIALKIVSNYPDSISPIIVAGLYNNLGVCYNRLANFTKAKIYLDKSETILKINHVDSDVNYINLMNSLAITYGALGLSEMSNKYYEKGIALAISNNSSEAYNLVNSYAIILGNTGKKQKGESLLFKALERAKTRFGENSLSYFEVLNNYANYLRENKIDNKKSIQCYIRCMEYLNKNHQVSLLKTSVYIGYCLSLDEEGESAKALEIIQSLLFSDIEQKQSYHLFDNPGIGNFKIDKNSLKILRTKYKILWSIYKKTKDQKTLESASNTAELIVSLLEKVRINISEEDSRLVLGDKYRDSYINAIRDFNLLYKLTSDNQYLEKAFEYSEKCKVAGLLTSTRELKAVQFHIPSGIADLEKKLRWDISLFNALIYQETVSEKSDTALINRWKESLLESTRRRDSLILVFEKQYPDYYAIKYNTHVAGLKDISRIVGRNGNYINYIISDTILYIFTANRKSQNIFAFSIDSAFFNNIRQFRSLLSKPSLSDNARTAFEKYKSIGYELYKTLIAPVKPYLISNSLFISPDNILSYIPFETIPVSADTGGKFLYSEVSYLMKDFDISYTYSATFMAESVKRDYSFGNKVIAFAPNYPEPIDIESALKNRKSVMGDLNDLPFARDEAEYISDLTGGKLFENGEAKESVYKTEAGKFDIIHLAMHTLINDKDPMRSTLIFSQKNDSIGDGYLKTYEVYGIPLKAKMVVLSSCNTGIGLLSSGEGILSLARGFIYSGSQSVVMSMWEIEDRSGTEIVKQFYKNLKNGNSKSVALRKARIAFLNTADQLRSHPYFWATMVIYGNNAPLYYSKYFIIIAIIIGLVIIILLIYYFSKRRYS